MEETVLVPAAYRCPDHDNHEAVTAHVRKQVEMERLIRGDASAGPFRVSVTCPGRGDDPASAHRRAFDGVWRVA